MITVKELKDVLDQHDDGAFVILQKDAEGNGYSPLYEHVDAWYLPDSTYSGEIVDFGDPDIDEEELEELQDNSEIFEAFVLVPVN